jgi:hypothetical protein
MTSTVTARSMAKARGCSLNNNQENTVTPLTDRAMTVSQKAARSAISCVRDLLACASCTSLMTPDRKLSAPVCLTSTTMAPSPLIAPPMTVSPSCLATGFDSPVSIDSFTEVWPLTMTASAGIFSPGLTKRCSPPLSAVTGTSCVLLSLFRRCAVSGIRAASFSRAAPAPMTDLISIQ